MIIEIHAPEVWARIQANKEKYRKLLKEVDKINRKINDLNQRKRELQSEIAGLLNGYTGKDIASLDLSLRPYNALKRAGIETIDDIVAILKEEGDEGMLRIRNLGQISLDEIKFQLGAKGILIDDDTP